MRLSPEAFELWNQLQMENRRQIEEERGIDAASETYGSVLASSPAKTLKLAMIFEIWRWLKDKPRDWQVIQADTLGLGGSARGLLRRGKQESRRIAPRTDHSIAPSLLHPERPTSTPSIAKRTAFAKSATSTASPTWNMSRRKLPEDDGESLPAPAVHHEVIQAHSAALVSGKWKVRFPFAISGAGKTAEAPSQALLQLKTNVKEARHVTELQEPDRKSVSQFPEWALRDKKRKLQDYRPSRPEEPHARSRLDPRQGSASQPESRRRESRPPGPSARALPGRHPSARWPGDLLRSSSARHRIPDSPISLST